MPAPKQPILNFFTPGKSYRKFLRVKPGNKGAAIGTGIGVAGGGAVGALPSEDERGRKYTTGQRVGHAITGAVVGGLTGAIAGKGRDIANLPNKVRNRNAHIENRIEQLKRGLINRDAKFNDYKTKGYYDIDDWLKPAKTKLEAKKMFYEKARKYHPDINKDPGASKKFSEASTAYENAQKHPDFPKTASAFTDEMYKILCQS